MWKNLGKKDRLKTVFGSQQNDKVMSSLFQLSKIFDENNRGATYAVLSERRARDILDDSKRFAMAKKPTVSNEPNSAEGETAGERLLPRSFYKLAVKITHFVENNSLKLAVKTRNGTNNSSKPAVKTRTTHDITGQAGTISALSWCPLPPLKLYIIRAQHCTYACTFHIYAYA